MKLLWQNSILCALFVSSVTLNAKYLNFIRNSWQHTDVVGTIFECSSYTAQELASSIDDVRLPDGETLHVAELGAGDGAMTEHIIERLEATGRNYQLDVYEILPACCEVLRERFGHLPQVRVIEGDFLEQGVECKYHVVLSTLPYNAFDPELTTAMLKRIQEITLPDGRYSYVAYAFFPSIRKALKTGEVKERFDRVLAATAMLDDYYLVRKALVWRNIPPIWVKHLKLNPQEN